MGTTLQQIIQDYGDEAATMPHDVAAFYLCHVCATDAATLRNMREIILPSLRKSAMFLPHEVAEAIATFEARFPAQQVAA